MDRFICGIHQPHALDDHGSYVPGSGHCCIINLSGSSSSFEQRDQFIPLGFWWLIACMAVLLVQILLGTQVREAIDR